VLMLTTWAESWKATRSVAARARGKHDRDEDFNISSASYLSASKNRTRSLTVAPQEAGLKAGSPA
jgi:hypothetical protein